jgi:hypothetical protein
MSYCFKWDLAPSGLLREPPLIKILKVSAGAADFHGWRKKFLLT